MTTHELKCWPEYLELIFSGQKTFEMRDARDRRFRTGDNVLLRGWDPATKEYTGEGATAEIGYVLQGGAFGLPRHLRVFSLLHVERKP